MIKMKNRKECVVLYFNNKISIIILIDNFVRYYIIFIFYIKLKNISYFNIL